MDRNENEKCIPPNEGYQFRVNGFIGQVLSVAEYYKKVIITTRRKSKIRSH